MQIQKYTLGNLRSNCYIVFNETNAFVIDPGFENDLVYKFLENQDLKLDFIYLTHGHYDHISGVKQLKSIYPDAPVYAPKKDLWWMTTYYEQKFNDTVPLDHLIGEPFTMDWQDLTLEVFDTPGHSDGGTILYIKDIDVLFSGDTLFFQTIGRTDIPYSDTDTLIESVKKIYQLIPDETRVYPGHGKPTSIGHEKKYNPFVKG